VWYAHSSKFLMLCAVKLKAIASSENVLIHLGLQVLFSFAFPFVERKHGIH
jgi:hypothetical protein